MCSQNFIYYFCSSVSIFNLMNTHNLIHLWVFTKRYNVIYRFVLYRLKRLEILCLLQDFHGFCCSFFLLFFKKKYWFTFWWLSTHRRHFEKVSLQLNKFLIITGLLDVVEVNYHFNECDHLNIWNNGYEINRFFFIYIKINQTIVL